MSWFDRTRLGRWIAARKAKSWGAQPATFQCGTCCDSGVVQVFAPGGTSIESCPAPNCPARRDPNNNDIVRVNIDWNRAAQQWKPEDHADSP